MKCVQCNQEFKVGDTLIPANADGDMICGLMCKFAYEKEHDHVFNEINDDKKAED